MDDKVISITKEQYGYLLPALRKKLFNRCVASKDYYYFFGNDEQIGDAYRRLEGLAW